jgi:hypothetical protein
VARGQDGPAPPATVAVLSGDVHHSYVARAHLDPPVHQVTCSPLHNRVPAVMRLGFRLSWSRAAERSVRAVLGRLAKLPGPGISWHRTGGPFFGNALGTIRIEGRQADLALLTTRAAILRDEGEPHLQVVHQQSLSAPCTEEALPR